MSFENGWAAVNLKMTGRVPRMEFDAETHWELVKRVTGIDVAVESPEKVKAQASQAFIRAWNYDMLFAALILHEELDAKRTRMGHGTYAAGGTDYDAQTGCPFASVEEALAFAPAQTYGQKDKAELVERFNAQYRDNCRANPEVVNMTGTYVSLFSGLLSIFGWELLLTMGGMDPDGLGTVANRYAAWMQQYFEALAESETTLVYFHDDIVCTSGPLFHPRWYRKYIFPNYCNYFKPLLARGKKIIFISDGNYTRLVDDIAATGVAGFFFEPYTDLKYLVEHYGQTHILIGNADTRVLLNGARPQIRQEVERVMALGTRCSGFFMGVTNMIPANTPVENALYYNEVVEELSPRKN
jgi:uroporphyrinogen-III decarboxylase